MQIEKCLAGIYKLSCNKKECNLQFFSCSDPWSNKNRRNRRGRFSKGRQLYLWCFNGTHVA